jgi:hypothetical protein
MDDEDEYVYALELTEDEAEDLLDGTELLVDVPGQFIERDPTIALRVVNEVED